MYAGTTKAGFWLLQTLVLNQMFTYSNHHVESVYFIESLTFFLTYTTGEIYSLPALRFSTYSGSY